MDLPTERFMRSLVEGYPPDQKNIRAYALFQAICAAFDFNSSHFDGCRWMVSTDMVSMLAACAYTLLSYLRGPEQEIHWESHDHILARTLRGFMMTLVIAIRRNKTRVFRGEDHFGAFAIPAWFVEWARTNVEHEGPEFYPTLADYNQALAPQ